MTHAVRWGGTKRDKTLALDLPRPAFEDDDAAIGPAVGGLIAETAFDRGVTSAEWGGDAGAEDDGGTRVSTPHGAPTSARYDF